MTVFLALYVCMGVGVSVYSTLIAYDEGNDTRGEWFPSILVGFMSGVLWPVAWPMIAWRPR